MRHPNIATQSNKKSTINSGIERKRKEKKSNSSSRQICMASWFAVSTTYYGVSILHKLYKYNTNWWNIIMILSCLSHVHVSTQRPWQMMNKHKCRIEQTKIQSAKPMGKQYGVRFCIDYWLYIEWCAVVLTIGLVFVTWLQYTKKSFIDDTAKIDRMEQGSSSTREPK